MMDARSAERNDPRWREFGGLQIEGLPLRGPRGAGNNTHANDTGGAESLVSDKRPCAARRIGPRTEKTATMAAIAKATTAKIGAHVAWRELVLGFQFPVGTWKSSSRSAAIF